MRRTSARNSAFQPRCCTPKHAIYCWKTGNTFPWAVNRISSRLGRNGRPVPFLNRIDQVLTVRFLNDSVRSPRKFPIGNIVLGKNGGEKDFYARRPLVASKFSGAA